MKKVFLLLTVLLLITALTSVSSAGTNHMTVTVSTVAVTLDMTKINAYAQSVTCTLEGGAIRFWTDTTAPTTTVGVPWLPNTTYTFTDVTDIGGFRAIRSGSTDGSLSCVVN